jgi:hypothetical protein
MSIADQPFSNVDGLYDEGIHARIEFTAHRDLEPHWFGLGTRAFEGPSLNVSQPATRVVNLEENETSVIEVTVHGSDAGRYKLRAFAAPAPEHRIEDPTGWSGGAETLFVRGDGEISARWPNSEREPIEENLEVHANLTRECSTEQGERFTVTAWANATRSSPRSAVYLAWSADGLRHVDGFEGRVLGLSPEPTRIEATFEIQDTGHQSVNLNAYADPRYTVSQANAGTAFQAQPAEDEGPIDNLTATTALVPGLPSAR